MASGLTVLSGVVWPDGTVVPEPGMYIGVQDLDTLQFLQLPATTLFGDATGSGLGSGTNNIEVTLAETGVIPNTYINPNLTIDAKGRVISAVSIPPVKGSTYDEITSTLGQTVFVTAIPTLPKVENRSFLLVFVDGLFQQEGETKAYRVTGPSQITFNNGVADGANVVI